MKLDLKICQSVVNLRGNADFAALMGAIAEHTSKLNEHHIKQPVGDEYLRGQLYNSSALLEAVNGAAEQLKKAALPKT